MLTNDQKIERIRKILEAFINHQNVANEQMSTRMSALEEKVERIDKAASSKT